MKKWMTGLVLAGMCAGWCGCGREKAVQQERISLSGAWALYPMVVKWAEEYQRIHPDVIIDISAGGAGKGITDALSGAVDIGMVSREINPAEIEKGAWWVSVVKDAVVPTIHAGNPVLADLRKRGVKKEELASIWLSGNPVDWSLFGKTAQPEPVRVFTRSDSCGAAETWAKYLGKNQEDLQGVGVYGDPAVADAVIKDPNAIGYNNIGFAYDLAGKQPVKGLAVLPIDVNGNGVLDPVEDVYGNLDTLMAAIGDGRYPSPPARDLHLVCKGNPTRPAVTDFLRWILTDGQKHVMAAGYVTLPAPKLSEELDKLKAK